MKPLNRSILRAAAALLAVPLVAGAESGAAPSGHFAPLAFLAGHCWTGAFPDGKKTDEHCFEWVYGGQFLRDRHVVREGSYGGETIYYWDADAKAVQYLYFNTAGGVSRGTVSPRDGVLEFPEERYRSEGVEQVYRSQWRPDGDAAYHVVTERQIGGKWTEAWRMTMRRKAGA